MQRRSGKIKIEVAEVKYGENDLAYLLNTLLNTLIPFDNERHLDVHISHMEPRENDE